MPFFLGYLPSTPEYLGLKNEYPDTHFVMDELQFYNRALSTDEIQDKLAMMEYEKFPKIICSTEYVPVCGSDMITYENVCIACHNLNKKFYRDGIVPYK